MLAFVGRESEYIDQNSGVSARLPIAVRELVISQVERRAVLHASKASAARLVDVAQALPGITGKVELVYEGEQEGATKVARHVIGTACRRVFDSYFPDVITEGSEIHEEPGHTPRSSSDCYKPILDWFAAGEKLEVSDDQDDATYQGALEQVPGLVEVVDEFLPGESPLERVAAMELVLEGLHQHSLLAKEDMASGASYSDMLGIMLEDFK